MARRVIIGRVAAVATIIAAAAALAVALLAAVTAVPVAAPLSRSLSVWHLSAAETGRAAGDAASRPAATGRG